MRLFRRRQRAVPPELRVCLCHPRRRGVLLDGDICPLCRGYVSPSLDELRRDKGRPIEVTR